MRLVREIWHLASNVAQSELKIIINWNRKWFRYFLVLSHAQCLVRTRGFNECVLQVKSERVNSLSRRTMVIFRTQYLQLTRWKSLITELTGKGRNTVAG